MRRQKVVGYSDTLVEKIESLKANFAVLFARCQSPKHARMPRRLKCGIEVGLVIM